MFDRKRSYEIILSDNVPEGALAPTFKVKFDVSTCLLEDSHYAKLNEAGFKFDIKSSRQLEISITPNASIEKTDSLFRNSCYALNDHRITLLELDEIMKAYERHLKKYDINLSSNVKKKNEFHHDYKSISPGNTAF